MIPSLNSCLPRMQAGEKRFARRLESHLEDDYLCWYEVPVGRRRRYSDFIILHPQRGLLLLEVKDWKLETIRKMDAVSATLATAQGNKTVSNPLEQARQVAYQLVNRLEADPQLVLPAGRHQGKLCFSYGYGVVLSHITRRQFDATDLREVLPEHQVICRDEMTEGEDPEAFQARLWGMFNVRFEAPPLSLPQLDRIRWHLFPEVRINADPQASLLPEEEEVEESSLLPDIVRVMDMQQEQLARSLGEGHRVIHGVAGSGKTLILAFRCLYLAKVLKKPILVLCYNITLAARLREMMTERGLAEKVHVHHFHDWCGAQLRTYHVQRPQRGEGYVEQLVEHLAAAVGKGQVPRGQYGAVMIDEGHDFEAAWLQLAVDMVDPDSNSLLLLYDDAQSIYESKGSLDFSLSSVGIQARGRTTVLRLNYRNTDEILRFAYRFLLRYLDEEEPDDDRFPPVEPQSAGRHGPQPVIRLLNSYPQEGRYIAQVFRKLHDERGISWPDMCITYRSRWMGDEIASQLAKQDIPFRLLNDSLARRAYNPAEDTVKLMTMHSSKGLEFRTVAVSGIGYLPVRQADPVSEAKLLYVAMTRATENLLLTAHQETAYLEQLREANAA